MITVLIMAYNSLRSKNNLQLSDPINIKQPD